MTQMINKIDVLQTLRTTLLDAEIVIEDVSSELMGIRDGAFLSGSMTRPDDPEIRGIVEPEQLDVIERNFQSGNFSMFVRETFMPVIDTKVTSDVTGLAGIYELSVFVPSDNGAISDIQEAWNTVKYIQDVFDPDKGNISFNQYQSKGIVIDSVSSSPGFIDEDTDVHFRIPINIEFRAYVNE